MSLTTYCEYNEVRSTLGVNSDELTDAVLGLPVYEMGLVRELNKLSTSLTAAFSAIYAKDTGSRTTTESELYDAVRLFSVYAVAKQVGVSLANFAPKDVGDGKASISRYSGEPFEKVMDRVESYYTSLRIDLRAAYETYAQTSLNVTASTTPTRFFAAVPRSYDPVTGT